MFQVAFTKIKSIVPHPNPEVLRLEIATVYDFQVVVQKGKYKVDDIALFIPVDSVLNQELETLILGPDPKIKFNNHRVRQIRIQKFPSQGLLVDVSTINKYFNEMFDDDYPSDFKLEEDYQTILNIKKYEPPVPSYLQNPQTRKEKPLENPLFHKFNGLENIKWYGELFKDGEEVLIQEKLHGSNCRAGKLKAAKPKLTHILNELNVFNWRGAFNLTKKLIKMTLNCNVVYYENVYGSNMVELTNRDGNSGFYGENVYLKVLNRVNAFDKIKENEIVYGELIGEGIQQNYSYGHKEHHFVIFDVKIISNGSEETHWLTPYQVELYAKERGFDVAPRLYVGPFNKQIAYELTKGPSVYCPKQLVREGIVIKAINYNDKTCAGNKKALKWISEKYLDKEQSDFH